MIKKLTSVVITVFLLSIFLVQGSVVNASSIEAAHDDIVLEYTIINEDGTIDETGIVPTGNKVSRFTWEGISLTNNQSAIFKPSGKNGLYCLKDIPMTIEYTLDRSAYAELLVYKYSSTANVLATKYLKQTSEFNEVYVAPTSSTYFLKIFNRSSDVIKIQTISLEF